MPKKRAAVRAESKSAAGKCNCAVNSERWQALLDEKSEEFDSLHRQWLDAVAENLHLATNAEADELMLAKQRERLIRLTEIRDVARSLICELEKAGQLTETYTLIGAKWILGTNAISCAQVAKQLSTAIAALDVDTAIPPRRKQC
jgi:hypothetical protein